MSNEMLKHQIHKLLEENDKLNGICLELKQEIIILRESRDRFKKYYTDLLDRNKPPIKSDC